MKPYRSCLALVIGVLALPALAQAPAAEPAKPASRKEAAKKAPPGTDAKKAAPAKDAKKAPPTKEAKKPAAPSKTQVSKNVTIYNSTPPPALKDKQGKDIPVTPDAYDVSSAVTKKK